MNCNCCWHDHVSDNEFELDDAVQLPAHPRMNVIVRLAVIDADGNVVWTADANGDRIVWFPPVGVWLHHPAWRYEERPIEIPVYEYPVLTGHG